MIYKAFDVRGIFGKKISFCGCMYLKHFKDLKASIKSLLKCSLHAQMRANNRYLILAATCYKTCSLLFVPNVFLFRKIGGTPFAKSKIQRMSPYFVLCMSLIFEPILHRWNFWGIPLRRNELPRQYCARLEWKFKVIFVIKNQIGFGKKPMEKNPLNIRWEMNPHGDKLPFDFSWAAHLARMAIHREPCQCLSGRGTWDETITDEQIITTKTKIF